MSKKRAASKKKANVKIERPTLTRSRLCFFCMALLGLPGVLIWHLASLQVLPNTEKGFEFLQRQGVARTVRKEVLPAHRGIITDRHGEVLAVSTPVVSIYANPQVLDMSRLGELAQVLGMSEGKLAGKIIRYKKKQFVYLARQLPPYEASKILSLNIVGVAAEKEFQRYYPAGEVAAHIVGFTNIDEQGQEGMELALNDWLEGSEGVKQVVKDLKGNVVKDMGVIKAARTGKDVQLSIDLRLQYVAYRELKNSIAAQGAASGSIVMLDVNTGEILAMANQPSYNPNNRKQLKPRQLRNRALTDIFEPGSTMKPFTIVAALESGKYQSTTKIDTNPGYWRVGGKTYSDYKNYGLIDLTTVLKKSSQVAISKIAMDLPADMIRDVFYRVGLGQASGTGFPGESVGQLPGRRKWHPTEQAAQAFGHGISVTALQLAQAYTVLANGGVFRSASILKVEDIPEGERVLKSQQVQKVLDMLKTVTKKGGTATRAQIKAYPVAGKTGTAHKVGRGGYADNKYVAIFAGIAPADNPEIVTVVIVHEPPEESYYGGEAAAPIFASATEEALRLLDVRPDAAALANDITKKMAAR